MRIARFERRKSFFSSLHSDACWLVHYLLGLAFAIMVVAFACPSECSADVVGFVETFSGEGSYGSEWDPYFGLDNPGWRIAVPEGTVTPDGLYVFTESNSPEPDVGAAISRIVRTKEGTGSFIERVLVDDLSMTTSARTVAELGFSHYMQGFPNEYGSLRLRVVEGEPTEVRDWGLEGLSDQGRDRTSYFNERVPVDAPADVLIELRYNARSREATLVYDLDRTDEVPAVVRGPFPYEGIVTDSQSSHLYFVAVGQKASVEGSISEWSLTPINSFDFSMNAELDLDDVLMLSTAVQNGEYRVLYDVNDDRVVDRADLSHWIHDVKQAYFGDANLDQVFDSSDLVDVFTAGEYEDLIANNSSWVTGDWNADGEFTSEDMIVAFQDGGYEMGPRTAIGVSVPEPTSNAVWAACGILFLGYFRYGSCGVVQRHVHDVLVELP